MAKYFLQYKNEVIRNLGNRDDSDSEKMIIASFNEALDVMSRMSEWKSLQTTTTIDLKTDGYYFELDEWDLTDVRKFYSIKLYDGTKYYAPLDYVVMKKWDAMFASSVMNVSSRPTCYTEYNGVVYYNCKSGADYDVEIRFLYSPSTVSSDLSEVDLTDCDPLLNAYTTAMCWLKLEEVEQTRAWMEVAKAQLKSLNLDVKSLIDFTSYSKVGADRQTGNYWANPFVRSVR